MMDVVDGRKDSEEMDEKILRCQAFVFRQLVAHLRANPQVQNIDLMNLSGFCRNCLAKWYFLGVSRVGVGVGDGGGMPVSYEEACEEIYGMPYAEYKKKYQTKATEEQLEKFKNANDHHAKHPSLEEIQQTIENSLEIAEQQKSFARAGMPSSTKIQNQQPQLSDVCCEPIGSMALNSSTTLPTTAMKITPDSSRLLQVQPLEIKVGVLTISDRAFQKIYRDESGPKILASLYANCTNLSLIITSTETNIVPDEIIKIQDSFSNFITLGCDLILTTGGTGISKRDVTPEATEEFVDVKLPGIPELLRRSTWDVEPLTVLSRAIAGVKDKTLIINLPGRPRAVDQWMNALLPILHGALTVVKNGETTTNS